jgi:tetratricopeptide (TPR) repeat protein
MGKTLRSLVVGTLLLAPAALLAQRAPTANTERATQSYRKGWELMHIEAFADAAKQFEDAIAIDRKFALAYYSLGRAQMAQKHFTEAIKAYVACRNLYVARAGEEFASQMEANRYREDQIAQYREAIRMASGPGRSVSQTSTLYLQHLQGELRILEQARQRNVTPVLKPQVPFFVSLSLGAAYFRAEKFADAEREYKAAIDENPASGETHSNLAVLYMTTGRLDEAATEIAAAEKTGYRVNPGLKDELKQKMGK